MSVIDLTKLPGNIKNSAGIALAATVMIASLFDAGAQTVYVATTGNDDTGTGSAGNPFLTISNGVAQAPASGTVMVATGTYIVAERIAITKAMTVRSWNEGVGGGEDRENTIIDGNNVCSPLYLAAAGIHLSGFTITGGNAIRGSRDGDGGGVFAFHNGTVSNCIVTGNYANQWGGGIHMNDSGALIVDCIISNNWLTNTVGNTYGGGVSLRDGNSLLNSRIVNNRLGRHGGGVYAGKDASISNCLIAGNEAQTTSFAYGGGVYVNGTNVSVVDCVISNNNSIFAGGGVSVSVFGHLTLLDSTITHNYALHVGGDLHIMRSRPDCGAFVSNCVFSYNTGDSSAGYGTGIADGYPWTAGPCTSTGTLAVANCRIYGNNGGINGGGLWIWTHGTAIVQNCEIFNNEALRQGGGIYIGTNQPWMAHATDMDGHTRIDRISRRVDMGCYEYLPQGTMYNLR